MQIEQIEPKHLEWVLEFCHDPQCALDKCANEIAIVTIFSEWLHLVGTIYTEKQKKTTQLNPPYLLQIWSNTGQCVYERPMEHPCKRWNLCNNQMLFMEDDINLIAVECSETKSKTIVRNFILQQTHPESTIRKPKTET